MKLDSPVWLAAGRGYWWLVCFRHSSICRGVGYGADGEPEAGRSNSPAVYIFAGALATVFSQLTAEAGQAKQAMWLDPRLLFRVLTIIIVQNAISALLRPNFRAAGSMSLVPADRNSALR